MKSYDPRCLDLAKVFLADEPELNQAAYQAALASCIQQAIEDFIFTERRPRSRAGGDGSMNM